MEMLQLIESLRAEEASVQRLFGKEGQGMHSHTRSPRYMARLNEAAKLLADVYRGKRPMYHLQEAMTTDDFPYLFGDVLDRQVLASYREWPSTWQNYCKRGRVRDFRTVKRFGTYGADQALGAVIGQKGAYPYEEINEDTPYSYAVNVWGRKIRFGWQTLVNDDLDALKDSPERLGRAARRSEEKTVTQFFVGASGPHASFYTVGNANIVTGNPALSLAGLQTAMQVLANIKDQNSEPIVISTVELVVPPALEITALNIINAIQIEITEAGGTSNQKLVAQNWMKTRVRLNVNPYIPIVASTANGSTSWFMFANPDSGRPAMELGFLIGHEEPEIFMKTPNQTRVGGGESNPLDGDFETDSIEYKLRHVFNGTRMDPKMTVGSNGSGV